MTQYRELPKISITTIALSAFLLNIVYYKAYLNLQRFALWGIVGLYLLLNIRHVFSLIKMHTRPKAIWMLVLLVLLWFVLAAITPVVRGTRDFSYLSNISKMIGLTAYLLAIAIHVKKKYGQKNIAEIFMKVFILGICSYVLFTVVILLFPALRQFIVDNVSMTPNQERLLNTAKYNARIGWAGFSGYSASIKCTMSVCFVMYFINSEKTKYPSPILLLFLIILLCGTAFYSRTSLLIALVLVAVVFVLKFAKSRGTKSFWVYLGVGLSSLLAFILFLFLYGEGNRSINWVLEPLLNLSAGEGLTSGSTSTIFGRMLFMPDLNTFLFGDGLYTDPVTSSYYMQTDLGFMRLILYTGVFVALYVYSILFFALYSFNRARNDGKYYLLSGFLLFSFAVFEFKGEAIYIVYPIILILVLLGGNERDYQLKEPSLERTDNQPLEKAHPL